MELYIAVTKVDKFNQTQSGDTVETIERPNGGISAVLADGRINGASNKAISTMVSHRVIGNISQGVRDGAAIRAVSSRLFAEHNGTVQANLNVVSADLQTDTILVSRNSPIPVFLISDGQVDCLTAESEPIGLRADVLPSIVELPIRPNMAVILFSDGVHNAGFQRTQNLDLCTTIESLIEEEDPTAQELADYLLQQSVRLDDGFPKDDMSVVVLLISPQSSDNIRRMNVSMNL
ncbi:MAG: SpoIIE family protein phosphatase [Anaerolineaceae bacterium]|jgi:serine phosphatase RsbU (regulator of sigma subunit)|nr:SpoIIE family protein phosphatase [Anaerolineaceae bacterium]